MSAPSKLYFVGLLGADDLNADGWMATDMAVVATLLNDEKISSMIYSLQPFTCYHCCLDGTFKYGNERADRLAVPAPNGDHVFILKNGTTLKSNFLENLKTTTKNMRPNDCLLMFLAAHGDDEGNIHIGDALLELKELSNVIAPFIRIFLWSTACSSGQWLHKVSTTAVAFSQEQNVHFPPYLTPTYPEDLPTWEHSTSAVATSTQQVLPLPYLTNEMLSRFTLVPCPGRPSHIYTNSPASKSANKGGPAAFRRHLKAFETQWPLSVNKNELIELAYPLLDCEPAPTAGPLVYLRKTMEHPLPSTTKIEELLDLFRHRSNCQKRVEAFIKHGSWKSSYIPSWNVFWDPDYPRGSEILTEFIISNKESEVALFQMITWRRWAGPPMIWADIQTQLALAWADAGRPAFSYDELEEIGARAEDLKKESILLSPSGQSSRPLQVIAHWPELRSALDDIGVLPDRIQPALRGSKSLA